MISLRLLAALLGPPEGLHAPFELRAQNPAACPDATQVYAAIERHLGRALAPPLGDGMTVELRATSQHAKWQIAIAFSGPGGATQRELADAPSCVEAIDAAALVIAIAIDPALSSSVGVPPPPTTSDATAAVNTQRTTPTPASPSNPPPTSRDAPSAVRAAPRPPRTRGVVGLGLGATFGGLPRAGATARLYGGVMRARWRVEVGGNFAVAPPHEVASLQLSMSRWAIDLRGCGVVGSARVVEFLPCAGIEAGQTLARPEGITDGQARNDAWLAALAAPRVAFRASPRVALHLEVDAAFPILRREYSVVGAGTIHRTSWIVGTVIGGVEVRLP